MNGKSQNQMWRSDAQRFGVFLNWSEIYTKGLITEKIWERRQKEGITKCTMLLHRLDERVVVTVREVKIEMEYGYGSQDWDFFYDRCKKKWR